MDNVSVSKGVFAHKGSYKIGGKKKAPRSANYYKEPWYSSYVETRTSIEKAAEGMRSAMFLQIVTNLKEFVSKVKDNAIEELENEIPTAILLTGINIPDHTMLFETLIREFKPYTEHVAVISSRDSCSLKSLMEETIYQFVNYEESSELPEVKKSQCTMQNLKLWHKEQCDSDDPLVIIISDFESSPPQVLHDFILILSAYSDTMKFVLLFGVATTLHTVHRSLSYDVTSKLSVQVFHMETQVNTLSRVLERTVFSPEVSFKLTGRAFQLLTDIFLFYDFSVENFLQGYKMCIIQHFYDNNINSLCCKLSDVERRMSELKKGDMDELKNVPSIQKYVERYQRDTNKKLQIGEFKELVVKLLKDFHKYMERFLVVLKCLHNLAGNLPSAPMGKQLREFYTKAVHSSSLTECQEYKECLQLLGFLSKAELLLKLESVLAIVGNTKDSGLKKFKTDLQSHIETIRDASLEVPVTKEEVVSADEKLSRAQLKEKLLKMSQQQSRSPYKQAQLDLIEYLDQKVFSLYLVNPNQIPTNEIFCYSDGNLTKQHIRGSLRAVIHTGLSNPGLYLNCECCKLENDDAIPSTLQDLSIIYKLHLESRKLINMYDWLQAFLIIVDPNSQESEQRDVDPKLQARFTQAVAELEFLGFIKTSKKKTDHVKRLT